VGVATAGVDPGAIDSSIEAAGPDGPGIIGEAPFDPARAGVADPAGPLGVGLPAATQPPTRIVPAMTSAAIRSGMERAVTASIIVLVSLLAHIVQMPD